MKQGLKHHHHHHHHNHNGSHREPSMHSISSSEISSEASSAVHSRTTPKIAAVIIAAILVISGLVGLTVYLVDGDKFEAAQTQQSLENQGNSRLINFGENFFDVTFGVKMKFSR